LVTRAKLAATYDSSGAHSAAPEGAGNVDEPGVGVSCTGTVMVIAPALWNVNVTGTDDAV
jgi:hypothetical protein